VTTIAFIGRAEELACESVLAWARHSVKQENGKYQVDPRAGAAYLMTVTNGKVSAVKHRSAQQGAIPEWLTITKSFHMENPFNDQKAALSKDGVTPVLLSSFFSKDAKCHGHILDKKGMRMKKLFEDGEGKSETDKDNAISGESRHLQDEELVDHGKLKRQAALAKARAAVQDRPWAQRRRRSLKLTASEAIDPFA